MKKNVGLIILDGWGIGDHSKSDAIYNADTPFMDSLLKHYPNATLQTSGEHVGLPNGQMGNSEVGHLNIGAGRIVYQELTRINKSISDGDFYEKPALKQAFQRAKDENRTIHFMGLVSKGGVHSAQEHLYALCDMANSYALKKVFIHAFTDGRDCDPNSGLGFIRELSEKIQQTPAQIASVIGRYYAMDRDNRWERIQKAYDLMVRGTGATYANAMEAIQANYDAHITDEFIEAAAIETSGNHDGRIANGDIVICFNFRTDRPREISQALTQQAFPEYDMAPLDIDYYTMTNYDNTFEKVTVVFEKENLTQTLGEVVAENGLSQVRIAETEKYPHVTFFFNGGREQPFDHENRILINSPKVATYDLQPEMSAPEVRDAIVHEMQTRHPNFVCLNFANPDMVGHTGKYDAIKKAVETVDGCLQKVIETGQQLGYEFIIIADHGNADYAINPDGTPNTAHSLNPVPVIFVTEKEHVSLNHGILADVAPTLLECLNVDPPKEMTGTSLIQAN